MNDKTLKSQELFQNKPVWTAIFSMAIPSCITILVMFAYNMADMLFIGQLGDTAQVAAISIVSPVFCLATAVGAGKIEDAKTYASLCFYAAAILGSIWTIIMLFASNSVLGLLGANEEILNMQRITCGFLRLVYLYYTCIFTQGRRCNQRRLNREYDRHHTQYYIRSYLYIDVWMGNKRSCRRDTSRKCCQHHLLCGIYTEKGQILSLRQLYAIRKPKLLLQIMAHAMYQG